MKRKTKVFYAVQVSNFTNRTGESKWLLRNDACTNIAVGIISTILEKYSNDFKFLVKLPFAADCDDVKDLSELFDPKYHNSIEFYHEEIPISPVTSRYNFNFAYHQQNANQLADIDVMINDENTLTKNWRVLFDSIGNKNVKIISTNYFLDSPIAKKVPEKIRYYERQMESFIASDIAAFQCEAGRIEAMEAYDILFKTREVLAPQSVWGVGAHYSEISKYHTDERFDIPTIYFGNRISDTANRYTNYDTFAEAIGLLPQFTDKKFRAVMLNPTRKVTNEQLLLIKQLSNGLVEVMSNEEKFTREDYLEFINKAHISCNLFVTEVHGGVTHCEALMAGNMVVMPRVNNYWHKFVKAGQETYPLFCAISETDTSKPDAYDLASKIARALYFMGSEAESATREICRKVGYEHESYESACERIVNDIRTLAEAEISDIAYSKA
jgi:hypothetical protein